MELPFRCVLRARENANLVKLMLRRHHEGSLFRGTFAANHISKDTTLGEFPGRCYGTVRVCFSCFCVYDLIERARKWEHTVKRKLIRNQRKGAMAPGCDPMSNSDATRPNSLTNTPETHAMIRAQHAISCLTTIDVAELRSYVSPPTAVSLVTTALFALLTGGQILTWVEARHAMANGENFLRVTWSA